MRTKIFHRLRVPGAFVGLALGVAALVSCAAPSQAAAPWGKLEPLKSRRADVERELGTPLPPGAAAGEWGALRFKVDGGTVTVTFVDAKFVATKKLGSGVEGSVLQIVLQHERSSATPESLKLVNHSGFEREDRDGVTAYRNLKDGIAYTFANGKLITTRYSASVAQLTAAQKQ